VCLPACGMRLSGVVLFSFGQGYSHPEVALNCGAMLRECIRHDKVSCGSSIWRAGSQGRFECHPEGRWYD
jgi:hypothetical protein